MTDPAIVCRRSIPPGARVSRWTAPDGWPLRRFDWPAEGACGTMLVQGGRADIFEKYLESFAHWHAQGWTIVSFDWRGHGGSGRPVVDAARGEFAIAVEDLAAVWRELPAEGPRVLLGHSMGGYLALRATVGSAVDPDRLVLVSPMLGLRSPVGRLGGAIARFMRDRGDPARAAWKANERPGSRAGRQVLLTADASRYADEGWWHAQAPDHTATPPSWAWLAESFESTAALSRDTRLATLDAPVLMLVAENDGLVDARAAIRVARRLPRCELVRFGPESAHEILREADPVRTRALASIDAFIGEAP
jgi:lysophospholipase